jgi:hypothetical protein
MSEEQTETVVEEVPAQVETEVTTENHEPEKTPEESKPEAKSHRNPAAEKRIRQLANQVREMKAQLASKPVQEEKPLERPAQLNTQEDIAQLVAFEAQKIVAAERQKDAQKRNQDEQAKFQRNFNQGIPKAQEKYQDFEDVLEGSLGLEFNGAVAQAIFESPVVHDLRYLIASDPELEEQIANAKPIDAIRLIGKLEARFESSGSTRKVSAAPPPIKPVGGRATAGVIDPEKESPKDYAARRNRELAERNGRPRR